MFYTAKRDVSDFAVFATVLKKYANATSHLS